MPKIEYIRKNFRGQSLAAIDQANHIIAEYIADGYDLTLRQLYYQFVARGLIENTERSYKNLGKTINDGRMAGLIDWDSIVDRTRNLKRNPHWGLPSEIIQSAARGYKIDKWADQTYRIEVWIEKEALAGILDSVCPEFDVNYFSCRGYVSQSEQWRAGIRLLNYQKNGQQPIIIHLGDHDPSGIDMTRDIEDRLCVFGVHGEVVRRIALNMPQIEERQPPPNPTKLSDSRAVEYVARFGYESWELDALEPQYISQIISDEIFRYRDHELWDAAVEQENKEREELQNIAEHYDDITEYLKGE